MNSLAIAIQTEGLSGTAAEVLAALKSEIVIRSDSTPRDWRYVNGTLLAAGVPPETVDAFIDALPTIKGGKAINAALMSSGVDFTLPHVVAGIEANSAALGPIAAILLAIGTTRGPRWRKHLQDEPTEAAIQFSLNQIACETLLESIRSTIGPVAVNTGKTVVELKSMIAGA